MLSKKVTALVAGALLVASTSAVAQTSMSAAAPLASAAMLQSNDDGGVDSTSAIAIGFVLIVAAILIATAGGDKNEPETPVSP